MKRKILLKQRETVLWLYVDIQIIYLNTKKKKKNNNNNNNTKEKKKKIIQFYYNYVCTYVNLPTTSIKQPLFN